MSTNASFVHQVVCGSPPLHSNYLVLPGEFCLYFDILVNTFHPTINKNSLSIYLIVIYLPLHVKVYGKAIYCGTGAQTQDFVHDGQVLYHEATSQT